MPGNLEERGRNLQENDRILQAEKPKPFSVQFEVDVVQFLLTLAALGSRLWMLGHPRAVVYVNNNLYSILLTLAPREIWVDGPWSSTVCQPKLSVELQFCS